ncbi:DUF1598 domain-containing protein [Crateriforma conspicua]|nr:DUF1598 domain-containing protein [Crateriforma conspicua]
MAVFSMQASRSPFRFVRFACLAALATLLAASPASVLADGGDGGDGGDVIFDFVQPIAGVDVDASGVLKVKRFDASLARQRFEAARRQAESQLMKTSPMRKVSLNRLEAEVARRIAAGEQIDDPIRALAGLTSIRYVFYYPETQDIVVAGPAEGFFADATDRLIGMRSGKPVVLLEDLVVALRAFAPHTPPTNVISVSIDPTAEGLQQLQQFMARVGRNVQPAQTKWLAANLQKNLGLQTVSIRGIPADTHFARVLVEADYRMKLIGIGLERLPVPVKSYVERANPAAVSSNAMERWYFQPNYDGVAISEDGLAMRIDERGVQLVGANERVAGGKRKATGRVNRASQAFCQDFTDKYPQIAGKVRIYAELEQLIDLAIAAAYIQEQDFYSQADWNLGVLADEDSLAVQTETAPQQVQTAVNAIWRGNQLMTPLGGGVQMQPRLALRDDHLVRDSAVKQLQQKTAGTLEGLKDGQWWWD